MRILLVDSKGDIIDQVSDDIHQSYVVDVAYNSNEGSFLTEVNDYDAVLVGPTLVDYERVEFYKNVRVYNKLVPIAAISSEDDPEKRILALDSGADVCIKYPMHVLEFKAQLRALIRRNSLCLSSVVVVGHISLDTSKKRIYCNNKVLSFRKKEYEIIEYLIMNKGKVISKEKLLEHVWDEGLYVFSNIVEVHIRNIRLELKKYKAFNFIKTVRGFGYTIEG
jgi:DNA-binding response OmpR family regulator